MNIFKIIRDQTIRELQEREDQQFMGATMSNAKVWVYVPVNESDGFDDRGFTFVSDMMEKFKNRPVRNLTVGSDAGVLFVGFKILGHDHDPEFGERDAFKIASLEYVHAACIRAPWALIIDDQFIHTMNPVLVLVARDDARDMMKLLAAKGTGHVASVDVKF